jgi:Na+/H+ antiporter NhaD/arsenite permease-like protein
VPPHLVAPFAPLAALAPIAIAALTLLGVAFGRLPGLPLGRTTFAVVGATALIAIGALDLRGALALIDLEVLALLMGLLLVNQALATSGALDVVAERLARADVTPTALLSRIAAGSALLSALLMNDTVVLLFTPLVITVAQRRGLAPLPYLLALACAANAGSVATLAGNPQNALIGLRGGIGYLAFTAALAPLALAATAIVIAVIASVHRRELRSTAPSSAPSSDDVLPTPHRRGARRAAATAIGLLIAFALGAPTATAALVAGATNLVLAPRRATAILAGIDHALLLLFAGLFVVIGSVEHALAPVAAGVAASIAHDLVALSALTALASTLVSNVPAVMLLAPLIEAGDGGTRSYLTLAMASTFAGNLTLLASIANLIVAERAAQAGVAFGFASYLRVGIPITLATLALGTAALTFAPLAATP